MSIVESTIVITGTTGQVGSAILRLFPGAHAPTRAELDLTSESSVRHYLRNARPRWIINPAAYTAVDKAEFEPELAHAINAEAPRILGEEAKRLSAAVLHFSTDYVFDGTFDRPYTEQDATNPAGVYGRTKLAGEQALAATGAHHLILRTSWVYSPMGKNFLLTILKLAHERDQLNIVADQHGAPTTAYELARLTAHLLTLPAAPPGVYHATAAGQTTWYGFASAILAQYAEAHPGEKTRHPDSHPHQRLPHARPPPRKLPPELHAPGHDTGVHVPAVGAIAGLHPQPSVAKPTACRLKPHPLSASSSTGTAGRTPSTVWRPCAGRTIQT